MKEFSDYVTDYKKEFKEYILNKNEKDYNHISKKVLEAKELRDSKKYSSADSKLNELLKLINSEIYNTIESSDGKIEFLDSVSAEELILKEDAEFINNLFKEGAFLTFVCSYDHGIEAYGINEKVFVFNVINSKIETNDYVQAKYYVGSKTRNVYRYNELGGVGGNICGIEENAYCFRYKKNGTNDVYVGFVFSDKSFSFKFAGSL